MDDLNNTKHSFTIGLPEKLPSYWWHCTACTCSSTFSETTGDRSIVYFIWDKLVPSDWDQQNLLRECPNCSGESMRITYAFPRKNIEIIQVYGIFGALEKEDSYLPMMWETSPSSEPTKRWFDFKYLAGRRIWGLNKPAVLTRDLLHHLFQLYELKTGMRLLSHP